MWLPESKVKVERVHRYKWMNLNTSYPVIFEYNDMHWSMDKEKLLQIVNDTLKSRLYQDIKEYAKTNTQYSFAYKYIKFKQNPIKNICGWYFEMYGNWYDEIDDMVVLLFESLNYKLIEKKIEESEQIEESSRGTGSVPKTYPS